MDAMERIVGVSGKSLLFVSNTDVQGQGIQAVRVSKELSSVSDHELISEYEFSRGAIRKKGAPLDPATMKVALVSVYGIQCGISTYTEFLANELRPLVGELRVFAEDRDATGTEQGVIRCWKRGEPLGDLAKRVREYDPDVVLIQHEYGLFPKASHWLSLLSLLSSYRVYVTLHSVYRHEDKTICEAGIPTIITHTDAAAEVLREKGITKPIHTIRHGCLTPEQSHGRLWNIYQTPHTLMQFGFGFRYKGWEESIRAVALLKQDFPGVFFTGIFSESKHSKASHDQYFLELQDLIERLGVGENVSLIRGYVSDEVLSSFLRTNSVAIFPYIDNGPHTVYGCSGAARLAMRAQMPVVVSRQPLFDDLSGICARVIGADGVAAEVTALWRSQDYRETQISIQNEFLERHSWAKTAERHVEVLSGETLNLGGPSGA